MCTTRLQVFAGGGDMGAIMRALDWAGNGAGRSGTPGGSRSATVSNWSLTCGDAHRFTKPRSATYAKPLSMGQDFRECWASVLLSVPGQAPLKLKECDPRRE
jgi:hypothetical protein